MKNKFLLFTLSLFFFLKMFSQEKIKADIEMINFMGRVPQKTESNSLPDNLLRVLYYTIQPENHPKLGYLNKNGDVVINPKYNMASDFFDNYANIIKDSMYGYVNKEGKETLLKKYDEVFFYYGNTGIAKKNGKYGLIDRKGGSLTEFKFTMITNFGFNYFKCQTQNKRSQILNSSGKIIFNENLKFDIKSHYFDKDSLFIYQENSNDKKLKGLVNKNGKIIIEAKYQNIHFINDDKFYVVENDKKFGFIDKLGEEKIPLIYDKVEFNISQNLIPVLKNDKWGFINRSNQTIIPFVYDQAHSFVDGLAFVKKGGFYGCINNKNKTKIKFNLEETDFPFFNDKLALFKKDGKYGYIDRKGKIKIPAVYDNAFPFINGLSHVELNGKVGYIDRKGNYSY